MTTTDTQVDIEHLPALPDKLSDLIRLALTDLEKCEASLEYDIDMGHWHCYDARVDDDEDDICFVCLAGSVMAQTLQASPEDILSPDEYPLDVGRKLEAINLARQGHLFSALVKMQNPRRTEVNDRDVTDYHRNPAKFKHELRAIAIYLESLGL